MFRQEPRPATRKSAASVLESRERASLCQNTDLMARVFMRQGDVFPIAAPVVEFVTWDDGLTDMFAPANRCESVVIEHNPSGDLGLIA